MFSRLKKIFKRKGPQILLEERSPFCPITVIVEQDERVTYLYLWGDENSGYTTRALWVRNHVDGPAVLDIEDSPPMMPAPECIVKGGEPPLEQGQLSVKWNESGDGVALYEGARRPIRPARPEDDLCYRWNVLAPSA